jgi:hypothetical protein
LLATLLEVNRELTLLTALYNSQVYPVAGSVLAQGGKQIPGALNLLGADGSDYASALYAGLVCGALFNSTSATSAPVTWAFS